MDAAELKAVLEAHHQWAETGEGVKADLREANLSGANLSGADLSGANLSEANLHGADLSRTCLDPELHALARQFVKACPMVGRHGGRIVWRTGQSQHVGATQYAPGRTYRAPYLSFSAETDCHPGIYAGSRQQITEQYPGKALVSCYVRAGDWVINSKGIRCKALRVLDDD